jgi:hypothetical protein
MAKYYLFMRFYVETTERNTSDTPEEVAMIRYRLLSIEYLKGLMDSANLIYAFKSVDSKQTYMIIESESFESVDKLVKRDPLFPFSSQSISPVISSRIMVMEIQEYLGEEILTEQELRNLEPRPFTIESDGKYFMARKNKKSDSPLLSEEEQKDILRRTVTSQRSHFSPMEVADDNLAGQPVGILIAKANSIDDVIEHVSRTEIYSDCKTDVFEIRTLDQSTGNTRERFHKLRPWINP